MIDSEGYRPNVGIILCNADGRLFWARRIGQHSWQFPQGGIRRDESPEQAMFRELGEEVGLRPEHVQVVGCTRGWLRYRLPRHLIRFGNKPTCIGQKQVWFLLRMLSGEDTVCLDSSERPEFDHWQWVDYWYPLRAVVPFKRHVYWLALHELAPLLLPTCWPQPSSCARNRPDAQREVPVSRQAGGNRSLARPLDAVIAPTRTPEPAPSVASESAAAPPMRRVEIHAHPVITCMMISARRGAVREREPEDAPPAWEAPPVAAILDAARASCPPAPQPRRYSRR